MSDDFYHFYKGSKPSLNDISNSSEHIKLVVWYLVSLFEIYDWYGTFRYNELKPDKKRNNFELDLPKDGKPFLLKSY